MTSESGNSISWRSRIPPWLVRNVFLLGMVSLLADMSSEIMFPLLPIFLVVVLQAPGTSIGLIGAFGDSLVAFMKLISGWFSDTRRNRKNFIIVGYGLPFFAKLAIGLSLHWSWVLILRPMERFGKGIRSAPRDALLNESILPENRGAAFGFHRTMDSAGAFLGSGLALLLLIGFLVVGGPLVLIVFGSFFQQIFGATYVAVFEATWLEWVIRGIMVMAAFVALFAVIPSLGVEDKLRKDQSSKAAVEKANLGFEEESLPNESFLDRLKGLGSRFWLYMLVVILFSLGNFTYMFFILRALGPTQNDPIAISGVLLLYIWFNIVYTITAFPAGLISDKIGRVSILIIGFCFLGGVNFLFALPPTPVSMILFFALFGVSMALLEGNLRVFVADLTEKLGLKGFAFGVYYFITGIALLPGGLIAGKLWEIGPELTFLWGGSLILAGVPLLFLFFLVPEFVSKRRTKDILRS